MSGYVYAALAGLQLASGYFASQNMKQTAELNRDIDEMNAEFAELDAYDAEVEGYTQEAKYQAVIDNTLSEQQARLAAADVDVNYGSAAEIQRETRFIGELNKVEIQQRAQDRALGYEREASKTRLGSSLSYNQAQSEADALLFQSALGAAKTGAKGVSGYQRSRRG